MRRGNEAFIRIMRLTPQDCVYFPKGSQASSSKLEAEEEAPEKRKLANDAAAFASKPTTTWASVVLGLQSENMKGFGHRLTLLTVQKK